MNVALALLRLHIINTQDDSTGLFDQLSNNEIDYNNECHDV